MRGNVVTLVVTGKFCCVSKREAIGPQQMSEQSDYWLYHVNLSNLSANATDPKTGKFLSYFAEGDKIVLGWQFVFKIIIYSV